MESITEALAQFDFFTALLIFIIYILTDALYAKYTLDVASYNELKAATIGATIHFFLAFGVISYTQNWLYIFPLALGSWVGTYFTVRRARLNKLKKYKQTPSFQLPCKKD